VEGIAPQAADQPADDFSHGGFVVGSVQYDIRATYLPGERHLLCDAPKRLGSAESVAPFQPGDLRFTIRRDDDDFVHPRMRARFEEERDFVDDHGIRKACGDTAREALLFSGHAWMNNAFQFPQFPAVAEHHRSERLAIDGPPWGQDVLAEGCDNLSPGRFSGPDNLTGQLIGIDDDSAVALEHPCDRRFSRRDASGQAHQNHAGENSMDLREPLTSLSGLTSYRGRLYDLIMLRRVVLSLALAFTVAWAGSQAQGGSAQAGKTIVVALDGSGDFTSIQAAVDAAAKGDTVFLRPGRYEQDLTIHSKDRLKLVGAGQDKVILIGREDLVGVLHVGKWPYGATNIEITDMTINEHGGHAVGLFNGHGVVLKRLTINGMLFSQQVEDARIEDCTIGGSETTGVQFADTQAVMSGNFIHDNDHGVNVAGKSNVRLERNVITRSLFEAVVVNDRAKAVLVSNTLVKNGGGAAFLGQSQSDVSGNVVGLNRVGFLVAASSRAATSYNALYNTDGDYLRAGNPNQPAPELKAHSDITGDPYFVDAAKDDFRLRPDTPLLKIGSFPFLGALPPLDVQ